MNHLHYEFDLTADDVVEVTLDKQANVRLLDSANYSLYQQGSNTALWIVDATTQTVKLVPVKVGVFRDDTVSIVAGAKGGDMVVTAGVHKLIPGQKVRIANEAAARK